MPVETFSKPFQFLPLYIFVGWDSDWYARLFNNYDTYSWPPVYPYLLRLISTILAFEENQFVKSAVLVNLCSYFAISFYFWKYVGFYYSHHSRHRAVLFSTGTCLLFTYPGHNVFFAAYAESLFLALTLGAIYFYLKGSMGIASLLVSISTLTRNMGVFLCAALILDGFVKFYQKEITLKQLGTLCLAPMPFVAWSIYLYVVVDANMFAAQQPWIAELITNHGISPEENPKVWVIKYLFFSQKKEALFNWICIGFIAILGVKKRSPEFLYAAILYTSLVVHTYRPFPWTRFLSTLFPLYLVGAELLLNNPKLRHLTLVASAIISIYYQTSLFLNKIGEP